VAERRQKQTMLSGRASGATRLPWSGLSGEGSRLASFSRESIRASRDSDIFVKNIVIYAIF
jgi:hypothetical protein